LIQKPVDVVVGMIRRGDGAVLMSSRPLGKPYAGFWEFPGGKVEDGEAAEQALVREFAEEIGVIVKDSRFAWALEHRYPHAHVRLLFFWVTSWEGVLGPLEGQQTMWVSPGDAWPYPVLPATVPLLDRIRGDAEHTAA
jgi:8-oxo-dGTP diphosphatase